MNKSESTNQGCFRAFLASVVVLMSVGSSVAQPKYAAWDFSSVVEGNHQIESALGIGNDFEVVKPVTIWSLGVFDHNGDGIKGVAVLRVQLYASNPDRARKRSSGVLLESVSFDAADSGELVGGFRYKRLLHPVTLLPGFYTITAEGFDEQNLNYKKGEKDLKSRPPVSLNDGGGLIRFAGCSHYHVGYFLKRTRVAKNTASPDRAPDRYAAGTFTFSPAGHYTSPFAADYAELTAGVKHFSWDTNKSHFWSYRYGSVSVLEANAFPVIAEPSGNRLIFEAAGVYAGDSNNARCVLFSDDQWLVARDHGKTTLFENAIKWAARKQSPGEVVVGAATNVNAGRFIQRGFKVVGIDGNFELVGPSKFDGCDVLVVDFRGSYGQEFMMRVAEFLAHGGGIVAVFASTSQERSEVYPLLARINDLLKPFGLAYRSSLSQLNDLRITNIQSYVYPPILANAYPAAELLRENRQGRIQLSSLEKMLALHTLSYAADGQPEILASLAATYAGSANVDEAEMLPEAGQFKDAVVLAGSQANANRLGQWQTEGTDLVSVGRRGAIEYDFNIAEPGVCRIQLFGSESSPPSHAAILISVNDVSLGQYSFRMPQGTGTLLALFAAKLGQSTFTAPSVTSDKIECLTPYLPAGSHKLRILWNNPGDLAQLRVKRITVQLPSGADADGDGVKDWVRGLVSSQSGLDMTNATLTSHVSPACIEGRDPFPSLMELLVAGADTATSTLKPLPAPNDRWYVNVPLSKENDVALQVSYQNGARMELRRLQWLPVNVLDGGHYTIRDGDSLLLVARPRETTDGTMHLTIETNQYSASASSPVAHTFSSVRVATETGIHGTRTVTVSGTYISPGGVAQTGAITVTVVRHEFKNDPACWVGQEREWELHLPAQASFEADQRLFVESREQLSDGGLRVGLIVDQSEPRYFLSRLGGDGPVLSSGMANGFDFWWAKHTYLKVLETYPDGSQLIEMMLIINPVLPEVTVQLDVLVGGVIFDDGTTTKQLTRADFDSQGQCVLRFIRPATFKPSVCHSIKILQGDTVIGRVW